MNRVNTLRTYACRLAMLFAAAFPMGCDTSSPWYVDYGSTIPAGAIPAPNGTYVHRFIDVQCAKAEADDFVIYKHEWYLGGKELGPYGRYHLNEIASRLPRVPFPIFIDPSLDEDLNETRRQHVINLLKVYGVPEPEQRVLIGFPSAEGLHGESAEIVAEDYLYSGFGQSSRNQQGNGFGNRFGGFGGLGGLGGFGGFGGGFGSFR